jgi:hypothetical protein
VIITRMLLADISERSMRLWLALASVFISSCSASFLAKDTFESAPGTPSSIHVNEERPPFYVRASGTLTTSADTSPIEQVHNHIDLVRNNGSKSLYNLNKKVGLKRKPKRADDEIDPAAPIAAMVGGVFALFTFLAFTALALDLIIFLFPLAAGLCIYALRTTKGQKFRGKWMAKVGLLLLGFVAVASIISLVRMIFDFTFVFD